MRSQEKDLSMEQVASILLVRYKEVHGSESGFEQWFKAMKKAAMKAEKDAAKSIVSRKRPMPRTEVTDVCVGVRVAMYAGNRML